jgi:uncharacterized protein
MHILIPITILFVGIFAVLQVPLTLMVGLRRAKTGIQFLDGGDQALQRRMRAHGNFTETVPIVLLAMAAAELTGIPVWALWVGGFSLLIGRLLHANVLVTKGWGPMRGLGMIMTLAPMLCFGIWAVYRALA